MYSTCRQLRNLEKAFGGYVRVCDRTALILDIFDQRAATREAALQAIPQLYYILNMFFNLLHYHPKWYYLLGIVGTNGIPITTTNKNVDAS